MSRYGRYGHDSSSWGQDPVEGCFESGNDRSELLGSAFVTVWYLKKNTKEYTVLETHLVSETLYSVFWRLPDDGQSPKAQ
jgi:hypothetical protein